jgi:CO/xanthine dehydrogenase Mo-binding subunit
MYSFGAVFTEVVVTRTWPWSACGERWVPDVMGLAEIALIGTAPTIANAVFHATGRRVRDLRIRIEAPL